MIGYFLAKSSKLISGYLIRVEYFEIIIAVLEMAIVTSQIYTLKKIKRIN
jgi:hypothetical protein